MVLHACCRYTAEPDGFPAALSLHRRSRLPSPAPQTDVRLWSLLCRNIGKDLSKISMPVSMNEPLNSLQVQVSISHSHRQPVSQSVTTDGQYK